MSGEAAGMTKRLLILVVAVLACAPAVRALPSSGCGPDTAFENDQVKIWFQGFKGHVQVQNKGDGQSYDIATSALSEVEDGATLASLNLGRAYPQDTDACTVTQDGNVVTVTFAVTADVRAAGGEGETKAGNVVGQTKATFVFHFNTEDNGSKFDVIADDWPWTSDTSDLVFALNITAPGATIQPADNGVGFSDAEGTPRGYIDWGDSFTVTYENGESQDGAPAATTTVEGDTAAVSIVFAGVDAGYTNLTYDPWAGVGPFVVVAGRLIGDRDLASVLALLPN